MPTMESQSSENRVKDKNESDRYIILLMFLWKITACIEKILTKKILWGEGGMKKIENKKLWMKITTKMKINLKEIWEENFQKAFKEHDADGEH